MIEAICTPCRAIKASDVKIRFELLKRTKKSFPIGLEVKGPMSDFTDPDNRKLIINNLTDAKKSGLDKIVLHSPVERKDYSSTSTNLSRPESLEVLQMVFNLANQLGAKTVTVHCEVFFSSTQIKNLSNKERKALKKSIAENLSKLDKGSVLLSIENMPYPLMGDIFTCSNDMVFDPLFADPIELYEFAKENSIQITFDTSHWATLCIPISLVNIYRKIEHSVAHLHLSDAYGKWFDGTSKFKEGLIPGEGNLGKDSFSQLITYLRGNDSKAVTLTIEVNDKDFRNPTESSESLDKVLSWLNS